MDTKTERNQSEKSEMPYLTAPGKQIRHCKREMSLFSKITSAVSMKTGVFATLLDELINAQQVFRDRGAQLL